MKTTLNITIAPGVTIVGEVSARQLNELIKSRETAALDAPTANFKLKLPDSETKSDPVAAALVVEELRKLNSDAIELVAIGLGSTTASKLFATLIQKRDDIFRGWMPASATEARRVRLAANYLLDRTKTFP